MSDKKIVFISLLQIIGPIFVILGHSLNGIPNTGPWYVFSKEWIYIFHMPLFFLISGYLLSFKGYLHNRSYKEFIVGKIKRLLIPYLIWNLLFILPKFFLQDYISDGASFEVTDILKGFVFPRQNVWGHTWFLLGLFLIYLFAPIFQKIFESQKKFLTIMTIILCVVIYVLPINTEFLALSDLHKNLLFFVIGCLLGQIPFDEFVIMMKRYRPLFIVGAIVFSCVALIWFEQTKMFHFIPCMFILFAFVSIFVSINALSPFWDTISSFSFGIYILHWPIMLAVRILLYQYLGASIVLTIITMILCGYVIPIAILMIIRRLPFKIIKKPFKYMLGV